MNEVVQYFNDSLESDIQFALAIYENIAMRITTPPELSVETLSFYYADWIMFYVDTLFEFWLIQEQLVFADQEEKDFFLELNRAKYEERLCEMLETIWRDMFGFAFIGQVQSGNDTEVINSPLQNVW